MKKIAKRFSFYLAVALFSATVYFLSARVGLLFGLPIGFASLIWPATGLGLILAVRWGFSAVIGSACGGALVILLCLYTDSSHMLTGFKDNILSVGLGSLVGLQVWLGVLLVRYILYSSEPENWTPKSLLPLFLLTILVAGIRAPFEALVLSSTALLDELPPTLFGLTVWLGDYLSLIGVLPIILWSGLAQRYADTDTLLKPVALAASVLIIMGWTSAIFIRHKDLTEYRLIYQDASQTFRNEIVSKAADDTLILNILKTSLINNPDLTREQFKKLAATILMSRPQISGIALARKIDSAERDNFEKSKSIELGRPIEISDQKPDGSLERRANQSTGYIVADYVEPASARSAIGFDLSSEPKRNTALILSKSTGLPAATAGFQYVGTSIGTLGVSTIYAVDASEVGAMLHEEYYLLIATKFTEWFNTILSHSAGVISQSTILVDDVTKGGPSTRLVRFENGKPVKESDKRSDPDFLFSSDIDIEGRRWHVSTGLPAGSAEYLRNPISWIGMVLPQLLAAILASSLLYSLNQQRSREHLEMQVGALSRRYFLNEEKSNRFSIKGALPSASIPLPSDSECLRIWTARLTRQYYEPVVDLRNGRVVGFESLLRMTCATSIRTDEFIAWAERSGHIRELTRRAIGDAVSLIHDLMASTDIQLVPWISINVSTSDLDDDIFISEILSVLHSNPKVRSRIKIEITENVLMKDIETSARRLQILRSQGVQIALDDFGTGYASLSYLRQLPIDTLKIDRSFIANVESDISAREIVSSMIMLSKRLNLDVVAEGVENLATAQKVLALGCSHAQGYLFPRAVPPAEVKMWLQKNPFFDLSALGDN